MGSASFTFVNTTGTPGLSPSDAKLMRAHITKTNFSNRRQRIAEAKLAKERSKRVGSTRVAQGLLTYDVPSDPLRVDLPLEITPEKSNVYNQFLSRFWSLVFLDGGKYPGNSDEEDWIQLLASDPALAEISIAIGLRYWSPDVSCQEKAVAHSTKAANIIVQRIKSDTAHTGPVIGAVLSMIIGERLMHNKLIWNIHVDGLVNLINERRFQGECDLPSMLTTFLIMDSTNYVFDFPLAYHRNIIDAIRAYGSQPICNIANISDGLIKLRISIDSYRKSSSGSDFEVQEIEETRNSLLHQARALQFEDSPFIQATSRAMELILHLSWYPQPTVNLTVIASELKEAVCRYPVRPCLFMDLTSCQLMLGAVAADEGSQVRAWFVARLRKAVLALRSRGWVRPLEILEKGFLSDLDLVDRFRALWSELDN